MKKVFITGGNRGLGLETAKQLGAKGYFPVVSVRKSKDGEAAVQTLRTFGIESAFLVMDVSDHKSITDAFQQYVKVHKSLDVLINNAGVLPDRDLKVSESTFEGWNQALSVNVIGAVAVTLTFLPLLKQSSAGRIVNVSSVLGSISGAASNPGGHLNSAYGASKAALNMFTVALAKELINTKVKVNSAHPGWIKTEMGGPQATTDIKDGVQTFIDLATLEDSGPSGKFFHRGKEIPW